MYKILYAPDGIAFQPDPWAATAPGGKSSISCWQTTHTCAQQAQGQRSNPTAQKPSISRCAFGPNCLKPKGLPLGFPKHGAGEMGGCSGSPSPGSGGTWRPRRSPRRCGAGPATEMPENRDFEASKPRLVQTPFSFFVLPQTNESVKTRFEHGILNL